MSPPDHEVIAEPKPRPVVAHDATARQPPPHRRRAQHRIELVLDLSSLAKDRARLPNAKANVNCREFFLAAVP
ncbi:MAG: hypothetical protein WBG11_07465 [Methylocella sp.]